jgi:hypothetical protein
MEVLEFENCVQIINVIIGVNDAIDFLCTSGIGNLLICDVKFTLTTENNGVYTTELIKPESVICWTDEQYCVPVTDCNDGAFVGNVDYDLCVLFARVVLSKLCTFFRYRLGHYSTYKKRQHLLWLHCDRYPNADSHIFEKSLNH